MPCTTILVGKNATNDGSTMIARNDDGITFDVKKMILVDPSIQGTHYKSVLSHLEIDLPENPLTYTAIPQVAKTKGVWAAAGINSENVGMTATETITSNPRVMGADPYVEYKKGENGEADTIGGIGEEDIVILVLPYIHTAREGVLRLGSLLEQYGTYEPNGIAFNDENEVWWLESIGGHHWIAKKVDDDKYVMMPNQFGLDNFDWEDAYGEQKANLCSSDLKEFVEKYHLDCNQDNNFNPRWAFGSHSDSDHCYNTPRAWYMGRYFNPTTYKWEGEEADFTPESDNIPWSLKPEHKITIEDMKYILSSYYQGTEYNPYQKADNPKKGIYRPIGVNRTGFMSIMQIRPHMPKELKGVEWVCFGPNPFNQVLPLYTSVNKIPAYLSATTLEVDTHNFYWASRILAALADPVYGQSIQLIERYQRSVMNKSMEILNKYDTLMLKDKKYDLLDQANQELADMAYKETIEAIDKVLRVTTTNMKCGYSRADN